MRMFVTCIHKQFFIHLTAKTVFRKHAFYSSFHYHFRAAFDKILSSFFFFTTWVTRVVDVLFVMKLVTCKNNFISVSITICLADFLGSLLTLSISSAEASEYCWVSASNTDLPISDIPTPFDAHIRPGAELSLLLLHFAHYGSSGILTRCPSTGECHPFDRAT
jgi:hypothetical protein